MSMEIIQKLYTEGEVKALIVDTVNTLVDLFSAESAVGSVDQITKVKQWADSMYPAAIRAVVEEVVRRHVQGVTFAIWAGPPGSGKGTNIDTVQWLGRAYAEVVSQGGAEQLPDSIHKTLLNMSLSQGLISTGTKGMFNLPAGEYVELFGKLNIVIGDHVAKGNFVGDSIVSLLVVLMLLLRLVQGYHRVQIDLWPRTVSQLRAYKLFIAELEKAGAKVEQEIVAIKVLPQNELSELMKDPLIAAKKSIDIGKFLNSVATEKWYVDSVAELSSVSDPNERFAQENVLLRKVMDMMSSVYGDPVSSYIIHELFVVIDRMTFRFNKALEVGAVPRSDEYPLSLIRRLGVYASETAPAFLLAAADAQDGVPVHIVSSFSTPEVVIASILDELVAVKVDDRRWLEVKKLAGELAVDLVNRKQPIMDDLIRRVGGMLSSV